MHKKLSLVLALCVSNGITLVASNDSQQDSKISLACCLSMSYRPASYGIDIDKADYYGITPLMHAVIEGNSASINWLLDNRARVNRANRVGVTPIIFAVQNINAYNFYFKQKMLRQLLSSSPSLNAVKDPKREISPKDALAFLRGCGSLGAANFSGADLLEECIAKEEDKRRKLFLKIRQQVLIELKKKQAENLKNNFERK